MCSNYIQYSIPLIRHTPCINPCALYTNGRNFLRPMDFIISISSIGSFGLSGNAVAQPATPSSGNGVVQSFLDYMKESPAQRMIDAWLKAHDLSEQALQN